MTVLDQIRKLREECDKATVAPWKAVLHIAPEEWIVLGPAGGHMAKRTSKEDAEFIASARTALPAALEALEQIARLMEASELANGTGNVWGSDVRAILARFDRELAK